ARLDDHEVAVEDALADHRVAADAQREGLAATEQLLGQRDRLGDLHRLDRRPRRDPTEERDLYGTRDPGLRYELERPTVIRDAPDASLSLEVVQVLVHGGERGEAEVAPDLVERRRIAARLDVAAQVVEQLLLPLGYHGRLL